MSDLRTAAQQALEALGSSLYPQPRQMAVIAALKTALAQERAEPDLSRCPKCNGLADNGFDRSIPPNPYICKKCMAEPAQEPVAWHYTNNAGASVWHRGPSNRLDADMQAARDYPHVHKVTPLYTAPPKLVPLTDEEIDRIGMTHVSLRQVARAVEKASWEKNHG